jgi:hypothetical protein
MTHGLSISEFGQMSDTNWNCYSTWNVCNCNSSSFRPKLSRKPQRYHYGSATNRKHKGVTDIKTRRFSDPANWHRPFSNAHAWDCAWTGFWIDSSAKAIDNCKDQHIPSAIQKSAQITCGHLWTHFAIARLRFSTVWQLGENVQRITSATHHSGCSNNSGKTWIRRHRFRRTLMLQGKLFRIWNWNR